MSGPQGIQHIHFQSGWGAHEPTLRVWVTSPGPAQEEAAWRGPRLGKAITPCWNRGQAGQGAQCGCKPQRWLIPPLSWQAASQTCACDGGFAGGACETPVQDLSSSWGAWVTVRLLGQSWTFFGVTVRF